MTAPTTPARRAQPAVYFSVIDTDTTLVAWITTPDGSYEIPVAELRGLYAALSDRIRLVIGG